MQEPPGELVPKENIDLCQMTSEIMHLRAKVFYKAGMPVRCLGINKKETIFMKIWWSSEKQQIRKIKPFKYSQKNTIICLEQICHR